MSEAVPPTDESEIQQMYRRTAELLLWYAFAEAYIYPEKDSVVALAGRLKNWRAVESQDPSLDKDLLSLYQKVAEETKDQVVQAHLGADTVLQRRLLDADKLLKDTKGQVSQSLDLHGAAVYAFRVLRDELGHRPSRNQVRERVDQWRKEGGLNPKISDRQWDRVLADLEELFRHG
jgi:hypothetical protein